jgi:hypothetical protein
MEAEGDPMSKLSWNAYYFASFDNSLPPIRTVTLEAENEDDAGKRAVAQMGRCMRVEVAQGSGAAASQKYQSHDGWLAGEASQGGWDAQKTESGR